MIKAGHYGIYWSKINVMSSTKQITQMLYNVFLHFLLIKLRKHLKHQTDFFKSKANISPAECSALFKLREISPQQAEIPSTQDICLKKIIKVPYLTFFPIPTVQHEALQV